MTDERGFTLVEALIAFAILSLTLVALYGAFGTSITGLARSRGVDEAVLIAQSRLAELAAAKQLPPVFEGAVEGSIYRWRIELVPDSAPEPPEQAAAPLRPQKIKLVVDWPENDRRRHIAVEQILLLQRQPGP